MSQEQAVTLRPVGLTDGAMVPYVRRGQLLVPAGLQDDTPDETPDQTPVNDLVPASVPSPPQRDPDDAAEATIVPVRAAHPEQQDDHDAEEQALDPTTEEWRRLAAERENTQVSRYDELSRKVAEAEHRAALEQLQDRIAAEQRARKERARDDVEAQELAALHRRVAVTGERARIRSQLNRTGEMRAVRLEKLRRVTIWVGLVMLVGFGGWSTSGVHEGLVRLFHLSADSMGWVTAWGVEPLLLTFVAGLIVIRAILKMSGGDVNWKAHVTEGVVLTASVLLNVVGGWEHDGDGWATALVQALGHSIGALAAAATAWMIGVVIGYITDADPWKGAPRVADLQLKLPTLTGDVTPDRLAAAQQGTPAPGSPGTSVGQPRLAAVSLNAPQAANVPHNGTGQSVGRWTPPQQPTSNGHGPVENSDAGTSRSRNPGGRSRRTAAATSAKNVTATARIGERAPRAAGTDGPATSAGLGAPPRTRRRNGSDDVQTRPLRVRAEAPEDD